ncbi:hypothetical protein [Microcoleus sp. bin38.metabat.b11b12b14.051]|uniref:hypothetical protein n=1 Tax=Microcoleus sp. bin38.metabat.b11b12b14.051 TaxID=2742709 RepID=UPI0025F6297D|nr:hypothetical protein [Microcoleus sp. bin38.metabat.b11b12b14.051]
MIFPTVAIRGGWLAGALRFSRFSMLNGLLSQPKCPSWRGPRAIALAFSPIGPGRSIANRAIG